MPDLSTPQFLCTHADCGNVRVDINDAVFSNETRTWGFYCDKHLPYGALVRERHLPSDLRGICPACGRPRGWAGIQCSENHGELTRLRWRYVDTHYFNAAREKDLPKFPYFALETKTFEPSKGESTFPQCAVCDRPTVMGGSLKSWTTWCGTRVKARLCSSCYQAARDISLNDISYLRGLEILKSKVSPVVLPASLQKARCPTSTGRFNCSQPAIQDVPKPQGVEADRAQRTMEELATKNIQAPQGALADLSQKTMNELFKWSLCFSQYGRTIPLIHDALGIIGIIDAEFEEPPLLYQVKHCPSCGLDGGCMCPRIEEPCQHLHTEWVSKSIADELWKIAYQEAKMGFRPEPLGGKLRYLACKDCGRLV